jgi:hypothetical protein
MYVARLRHEDCELNDNATIHRTPDGAVNECVLFHTSNDACLGQENVDHFSAWVERVSNGEIVVSWVDIVELYCTQQHRTDAT